MGLRSYGPDKTWTCIQLDGQGDRQADSQGDSYITPWTLFAVGIRTYNDKAYTSPYLFGQFFNFRIFIKFFIHEVKKTSKF